MLDMVHHCAIAVPCTLEVSRGPQRETRLPTVSWLFPKVKWWVALLSAVVKFGMPPDRSEGALLSPLARLFLIHLTATSSYSTPCAWLADQVPATIQDTKWRLFWRDRVHVHPSSVLFQFSCRAPTASPPPRRTAAFPGPTGRSPELRR